MTTMAEACTPRSDQLNADDCISGPITIKVTEVIIKGGQEQPVAIHYVGDNGKPYKPCKSMCRVLVTAWGPDAKQYVGRSLTLYRDGAVKWGGMEVGGLRISHMSDIPEPLTMALTATKGSRKPFTVSPLQDWGSAITAATTLDELAAAWTRIPKSLKPQHEAAKDARKLALQAPAQSTDSADFAASYTAAERAAQ